MAPSNACHLLRDRWGECELPSAPVLIGEWELTEDADLGISDLEGETGDVLAPIESSRLRISTGTSELEVEFATPDRQLPEAWLERTLRELSSELEDGEPAWERWTSTSPIPVRLEESFEPSELERELEEQNHLAHLQEVCRHPHFRLESTVEREPVHRARRISPRAISYLAAHPEDWEHRTLRSVQPSHVLARRNDFNLNVYENRLVARLLDTLFEHVTTRLAELRKLQELAQSARNFSEEIRGTYQLRQRMSRIWGEAFEADDMWLRVQERLESVRDLHTRLGRLRSSELYQAIPKGATIGNRLESTNVLTDHDHYRHVAQLWRTSIDDEGREEPSPDELWSRRQSLCRSYDTFVTLLMVRALDDFGWHPIRGTVPARGESIALQHDQLGGEIVLERDDGTIRLERRDVPFESRVCRIIPVPVRLGDLVGDECERVLERFDSIAEGDRMTLFAHLGRNSSDEISDDEAAREMDGQLPSAWTNSDWSELDLVELNPLTLESQEHLALALRRWLCWDRFLAYPPEISAPRCLQSIWADEDWLDFEEWDLEIDRPPNDDTRIDQLREQGRARAEKMAQKQGRADLSRRADTCFDELEEAIDYLLNLQWCPVCHHHHPAGYHHSFTPRPDTDTFVSECESCSAQWGLESCGTCGARYPFLQMDSPPDVEGDTPDDWTRHLGRDMLADMRDWGEFACPSCEASAEAISN